MKKYRASRRVIIAGALLLPMMVIAQEAERESETLPPPGKPIATTGTVGYAPEYKAPREGFPVAGSGGSRGAEQSVVLWVLTPEDAGLTTQEQPSLYWYTSQPTSYPIELILIEVQAIEPILRTRINSPSQASIQRIRLADYGVRLKTGSLYRWFIAIVPDPARRSKDILAGGFIELVEAPAALRTRLAEAGPTRAAVVYADEGIWYDALSSISDLIDAAPQDATLRAQRAALLEQVQLQEAADFDRRAAR